MMHARNTAVSTACRLQFLAWVLVLQTVLLFTGATLAAEQSELEAFPLRPPDTSSPRDTLRGFLNATEIAQDGLSTDNAAERLRIARRQATAALDYSDTTNGNSWDEQTERILYLKEILDRIALPALDDIPGDAEVAVNNVDRWTIPNTQLTIQRVEEGERAGEFLFSAATVANLHRDFRRIRHLPYRPDVRGGLLELMAERFDAAGTIAARIQAELMPVDAVSPRIVFSEFLSSVNEAYRIVMAAEAESLTGDAAREADEQATRLVERATNLLDLSQVPTALRSDVAAETVLLLKEVIDRSPLPAIGSVPGVRTVALTDDRVVRWVFPHTQIEIVPRPDAPDKFAFSAETVERVSDFYERVKHLPYRGQGTEVHELRFEDDYPDAAVSPDFYEFYIRTPGSLVPGASWLGRFVDAMPESLNQFFLGQTLWQWLALMISLVVLVALLTVIYLGVTVQGRRVDSATGQWVRLVAPVTAALVVSRYTGFLDGTVNLTGPANATSLIVGTGLVYLFVSFAVFRVIVALVETLVSLLRRRRGEDEADELESKDSSFDTSLLRLFFNSLAFVTAVAVFVSGLRKLGIDVLPLLAGLGVGGLAVALAIRPTLENMIGGVILYADRPIHVGDFCKFGNNKGVVERIGLRSTRIRGLDRTVTTVPNSVFADMQITNFANCDKMLINSVIGLRYETTPEQLRRVLARMRQICFAHPMIETDTLRIRFGAFGASSLDLNVRVYALVADWNDFHAVREDLFMRFMEVIEESGTEVAFPSTTVYMARDDGLDPERVAAAEAEVAGWREAGELPFPRTPEPLATRITDTMDYPPKGSPEAIDK